MTRIAKKLAAEKMKEKKDVWATLHSANELIERRTAQMIDQAVERADKKQAKVKKALDRAISMMRFNTVLK
jgi:hypothetical protein